MLPEEFTRFIHALARASGEIIRPFFFNADVRVEIKEDQTPVTQADRNSEEAMRDLIRHVYPGHGIIGEEFGRENESAEYVWVLDPIDGTISFASGCPIFGTLIGLLHNNNPILGAINNPVIGQMCVGDNEKTEINGRRVQLRQMNRLSEATLLATDIRHIAQYRNKEGFEKLLAQTRLFRTWGDCFGYLLVASGGADIMLDPIMNPWDLIPLIPIIRGAGGVITDWAGADPMAGNSCVAAGTMLHPRVIRVLNSREADL